MSMIKIFLWGFFVGAHAGNSPSRPGGGGDVNGEFNRRHGHPPVQNNPNSAGGIDNTGWRSPNVNRGHPGPFRPPNPPKINKIGPQEPPSNVRPPGPFQPPRVPTGPLPVPAMQLPPQANPQGIPPGQRGNPVPAPSILSDINPYKSGPQVDYKGLSHALDSISQDMVSAARVAEQPKPIPQPQPVSPPNAPQNGGPRPNNQPLPPRTQPVVYTNGEQKPPNEMKRNPAGQLIHDAFGTPIGNAPATQAEQVLMAELALEKF